MKLPTFEEIVALHKKYAPTDSIFNLVFTHCQIVWEIANQLITVNSLEVNMEVVEAASLLHDIGVYELFDKNGNEIDKKQYISHGVKGEAMLKSENYSEVICRIASHHTGVGLSKEDILTLNLPLPVQDYVAETIEERLVMYSDKFHSKTEPPCFNSFEWYKKYVGKFGESKTVVFQELADEFGVPDLKPMLLKYGHELRG